MNTMPNLHAMATRAGQRIKQHAGGELNRAVILGSGLATVADAYSTKPLDYKDIPGMLPTSVTGHSGKIIIAKELERTAFCIGRLHLYEGHSAQQVAFMIYALSAAGVTELIVTNAAGALNPDLSPGELMLISDHINHTGNNPLVGWQDETESRFVDMSEPYSLAHIEQAEAVAQDAGIIIRRGVYAGVLGPSLETSAERRMLRQFGADAVGMSTIMEVIAARHCKMNVLALSAITNLALGDESQRPDSLEEIFMNAAVAADKLKLLLNRLLT